MHKLRLITCIHDGRFLVSSIQIRHVITCFVDYWIHQLDSGSIVRVSAFRTTGRIVFTFKTNDSKQSNGKCIKWFWNLKIALIFSYDQWNFFPLRSRSRDHRVANRTLAAFRGYSFERVLGIECSVCIELRLGMARTWWKISDSLH